MEQAKPCQHNARYTAELGSWWS